MAHRFVNLRADGSPVHLCEDKKKKFREVIWGDDLRVRKDLGDGWLETDWAVRSPTKRRTLYIRKLPTLDPSQHRPVPRRATLFPVICRRNRMSLFPPGARLLFAFVNT